MRTSMSRGQPGLQISQNYIIKLCFSNKETSTSLGLSRPVGIANVSGTSLHLPCLLLAHQDATQSPPQHLLADTSLSHENPEG